MNVLQESPSRVEELEGTWIAGTPVASCQLWPPSVVLYSFGCALGTTLSTLVQRRPKRGFEGANVILVASAGGLGSSVHSLWAVARDTVAVAVGERAAVAEGCLL